MPDPLQPKLAVVIPTHNRRETTLRCLRRLREASEMPLHIIVVDSGSTDGTVRAVRNEFSDVDVIETSANIWWAGAVVRGMRRATELKADFVYWLNDDTMPAAGAFSALLAASRQNNAIAGGVSFLPNETTAAYGGMRKTRWGLQPVGHLSTPITAVDALHGNFVCIPRAVVELIGYPDEAGLPHALADLEYTLRARRAGVPVLLVAQARAVAQPNLSLGYKSWLLSDVPIPAWWRELGRRGSHLNLRAQWRFRCRYWGIVGGLHVVLMIVRLAVISVIRLVIPHNILLLWWGKKSRNWQHEQRHQPTK